ncbi:hypothetical protein N7448_005280 [Penicillium atrosanguineum]|uniref:Uncharacterized protein n=1 Tax=Penicillium atrosanguineum TaxID=1132637 RepID=A0A9W9U0M9_9EURO|nr:uncharacterized protein N7443_009010 [Penicillium atrosanguineum]KAJ5125969.1 hypothetical protein N7526_008146 [Penicillium atrosanguineum]KAJ5136726.1 hypothetical protein N7448_005280 [Penicillium atrosanguineum]KAJ5293057.1 hypothetical protein N7443_009010 [Penicillium atrosanguineum]KAJ5302908.1 hypothetical protein N7476_009707 [Penicillium atrosanguineum]
MRDECIRTRAEASEQQHIMAVNVRSLEQTTCNFPSNSFEVRTLTDVNIKALKTNKHDGGGN